MVLIDLVIRYEEAHVLFVNTVHEDEIPKTALRMRYGRYEFTAMPFWLSNAPVIFMDVMNREHESYLKLNLELLKKQKCYVKPNKANIVFDAWRMKGGVKPRLVRNICRTIQAEISEKMTLIMEEAHVTKYSVHTGAEIGESKMIGLEIEQETTKVVVIMEAKDHQENVVRFGKKGELAPRYIGPFEILERIGPVAYRLRLPDELSCNAPLRKEDVRLFARLIEEFGFALHRASQAGQSCVETCRTARYNPPRMIVIIGTGRSLTALLFDIDTSKIVIRHYEILKSITLDVLAKSQG
nr:putative reverse transcriptase domain, ribonuclease H-like domain, aspartic peptidase domain protein [Tanacetum cinerariifolium]